MAPLELANICSALLEISQNSIPGSWLDGEYHPYERDDKRPRLESTTDGRFDIEDSRNFKPGKPRPHICGTCSRSFARIEHLKRHERSHVNVKPFECPECTRCFARRDLLLRHQQTLHMTTGTPSTTSTDLAAWSPLGSPTANETVFSSTYSSIMPTTTNQASSQSPAGRRESNGGLDDEEELTHLDVEMKNKSDCLRRDMGYLPPFQMPDMFQARGRTPERTECSLYGHSPLPGSRASSSSSVRTMIDERLEWAHQDRVRSASRRNSVQKSPFHEHSPFYAEFAGDGSSTSFSSSVFICECCPKKPKTFNTQDDLMLHESEKIFSCAYCPHRFKTKTECERHQNSLHLRRHSWSCANVTSQEDVFNRTSDGLSICGYCGAEFQGHHTNETMKDHLDHVHRFSECNKAKKFFRADHFRQHLKHSHSATVGKWVDILESLCIEDEPLPQQRSVATAEFATPGSSFSKAQSPIPLPPPFPTYIPGLDDEHDYRQRADQFRQYLQKSHDTRMGAWGSVVENTCLASEPPPHGHAMATSNHATTQTATPGVKSEGAIIGNSDQPGGPRENFTSRACLHCRKKKIRCDGVKPCSQCQGFEPPEACVYSEHTRPETSSMARRIVATKRTRKLQAQVDLEAQSKTQPASHVVSQARDSEQTSLQSSWQWSHEPSTADLGSSVATDCKSSLSGGNPRNPIPISNLSESCSQSTADATYDGMITPDSSESASAEMAGRIFTPAPVCIQCVGETISSDGLAPHGTCQFQQGLEACTYPKRTESEDSATEHDRIPRAVMPQSHVDDELTASSIVPATSTSPTETDKSEPQFVCPTCQRSFTRRAILTNHQRTHTGEKPFSCRVTGCGQTFAQHSDKTRHEQAQHTEKTFRCGNPNGEGPSWGCGKTFRRKDGLLEHHTKTKKGKQCLIDRDNIIGSPGIDGEGSFAI